MLVAACCKWLKLNRIAHTRINQKPHRQADGSWRNQGGDPGAPDVIACYEGRCVVLEMKTGQAGLRPVQSANLDAWRGGGAIVAVVRSVAEMPGLFAQAVACRTYPAS
jgi:hypothetical protein